jgi:hypothetical protein
MANQGKSPRQDQKPTGTSGRQSGDTDPSRTDNNDARRGDTEPTRRRVNHDDEEGPGLGGRMTNR